LSIRLNPASIKSPTQNHDYFSYLIIGIICFSLGFISASSGAESKIVSINPSTEAKSQSINLDEYWQVWGKIQDKYVDVENVNEEDIVYGSIKGLVNSLGDPYSSFMTPSETEIFQSSLNSELEGIGAELSVEDNLLVVVSPLKNSPAEQAGIKPGDIIFEIDHQDATDYSFLEAVHHIRGKRGSTVVLGIIREGEDEPLEISIVRDKIELESVSSKELDDNLFYISLNQFSDDTEKEFFEATNQAILLQPKGIILDLRFNGGGYLDSAVNILGEFLADGSVAVVIESGADKMREELKTQGSQKLADIPLVVLINEGSASASEILAGALQDYGIATIIGTTSYGKGTVQEVEILDDNSSLRITIAKWLTPLGRSINQEGVSPDIISELDEEKALEGIDSQLETAKEFLLNLPEPNQE
jgi:carboxyl-terminal processing protease